MEISFHSFCGFPPGWIIRSDDEWKYGYGNKNKGSPLTELPCFSIHLAAKPQQQVCRPLDNRAIQSCLSMQEL